MKRRPLAGLDGCPAGWACVSQNPSDGAIWLDVLQTDELADLAENYRVVAVDIPIGLGEGASRDCDLTARRLLSPHGSRVFPAPPRACLAEPSFDKANKLAKDRTGRGISRQAYNLFPRIRAVDEIIRQTSGAADRFYEVHPELAYREMNDGYPVSQNKKTAEGKHARQKLLDEHIGHGVFDFLREQALKKQVGDDDLADALAALWVAQRITQGQARSIELDETQDAHGLRMSMWV
jgi:predicted RNase H-like nuclease